MARFRRIWRDDAGFVATTDLLLLTTIVVLGMILGLVVFSHWILDFIVHIPDLPLFLEGSPNLGLGLWGSGTGLIASIILELALFAIGIAIYLAWRKHHTKRKR